MSAYCQTSSATIKPSYCSTPPDPTSPYLRITQFPTHPPPRKMSFSLVQAVSAQPALSSRARPSTRTRSARAPTTPFLRGAVLRPVRAIPTDDEDDVMNAGWSATWTLQSYEDLAAQINTQAFELKDVSSRTLLWCRCIDADSSLVGGDVNASMTAPPHRVQDIAETALGDVMSSPPITTTTDTPVSELAETFRTVSGLPVVNVDGKLIGVVSKKDVAKNETGTVGEVMSKPPIAAKPGYKVSDGAAIMLKYAVHRLPIVDTEKRVIGIVTRTDIAKALSSDKEAVDV
mmetsp:Transcript_20361/g.51270  ORF Transcript_20361/g.51270 Transcript_20361/m.51270 type:complete len:288 (+) Transcript_20361:48-911(+)